MPKYTVELLVKGLRSRGEKIAGAKVALLGLSYKPDIEDDRESPAHEILKELRRFSLKPVVYDPHARGSTAKNLKQALKGTKGAVIATAHSEFKKLRPRDFQRAKVGVVIDGRNCLPAREFDASTIYYRGIGRS